MTRLGAGRSRFRIPTGVKEIFSSLKLPYRLWSQITHMFKGCRFYFPEVKADGA
jgi:hypothetical protein